MRKLISSFQAFIMFKKKIIYIKTNKNVDIFTLNEFQKFTSSGLWTHPNSRHISVTDKCPLN